MRPWPQCVPGQADVGLVYGSDAVCTVGCRLLFRVRRLPLPIR
jgi:hypothetical protein